MPAVAPTGFMTATNLRRVRRQDTPPVAHRNDDPYPRLMACWVDYMRLDERDLGAQCMRLPGDAIEHDNVHDAQRAADLKIGEAVGAMVDSLTTIHRWAIYKSQRIATAWRFPNADYEVTLTEARAELEAKLRKNVATRLYFP